MQQDAEVQYIILYSEFTFFEDELSAPFQTPMLDDQSLLTVHDFSFNIFTVTFHKSEECIL
jgi:hypothetical protein